MKQIILKDISSLRAYERNARKHSDKQISQIEESIKNFGFNNPILIDTKNTIIAGHGRWLAAKKLKMGEVPAICLDHLSETEVKAYILADNKLAELAGWDQDILALELQHLISLDLDFSIELTGFEMGEIDFIIDGAVSNKLDSADEVIDPKKNHPSITKRGDLWVLGDHKLYCGDSLDEGSYAALMGSERAQMIFTDPPYNVPIDGHVGGKGAIKHREFEMGVGEMTQREFTDFLVKSMTLYRSYSSPGAVAFCCMDCQNGSP